MRDAGRIEPFLAAVRKVWYENPDFRFGQLVDNVLDYNHWDVEDDTALEAFKHPWWLDDDTSETDSDG